MTEKWRGIKTTQIAKFEDEPKTIINRFGQKSISLPRIDDKKRWAGFPGITGISRKLARIIPFCWYYVEPLAGTAKVFQELKLTDLQIPILNDKSRFIFDWLKHEFPNVKVTQSDFIHCIKKWDSINTFFIIDHPWNKSYFDQKFSCFDRDSTKQYDEEILKLCEKLQGKFIITTRKENKRMLESGFYNKLCKSEYVVSGKYPEVLLTSNFKIDGRKLR